MLRATEKGKTDVPAEKSKLQISGAWREKHIVKTDTEVLKVCLIWLFLLVDIVGFQC